MLVMIVESKKDDAGNNWLYSLKDSADAAVDSARFFEERELRVNV
jgi:hypothetical protein